jgi:hypothetical protein
MTGESARSIEKEASSIEAELLGNLRSQIGKFTITEIIVALKTIRDTGMDDWVVGTQPTPVTVAVIDAMRRINLLDEKDRVLILEKIIADLEGDKEMISTLY